MTVADLPRIGRKESKPPRFAGLDAGARGFADYTTPDADALLLWYRSGGSYAVRAVQLFLARRAIAACWECATWQAAAVIEDAMKHVAIPPRRRGAPSRLAPKLIGMRKDDYHHLRATAAAWLRAGIMDAEWRHGLANAEPPTPASRQDAQQDRRPPALHPRALPRDNGQQLLRRAA